MPQDTVQTKRNPNRDRVILEVAAELFYERGFGNVGVDEIGERAGVTGPAIYRHFSGKNEILATLFDEALDSLFAATGSQMEDPWEELQHRVVTLVRYCVQQYKLASVFFREERSLEEPYRRRLHRREADYIQGWVDCLQRALPDRSQEDLWVTAQATVGMITSVVRWPPEVRNRESLPEHLTSMAIDGIASLG